MLIRHYKDYSARKGKTVEPKSQLSEGELSIVATLYSMLREEYGFYPEGLSNGKLMWGVALKSDIQLLMEKDGAEYEKRGKEISENPGEFGRIVEGRRIVE